MSRYVFGRASAAIEARRAAVKARASLVGTPLEALEPESVAVAARRGNTEGLCGRGCCWTPWSPWDVCAVKKMCNCHHAPVAEVTEYLEYDEALDNVTPIRPDMSVTRTEDGQVAA